MEGTPYAGIGSRKAPKKILRAIHWLAWGLARQGCMLRSGAASGADTAFERGSDEGKGLKEIFLPWERFNGRDSSEKGVYLMDLLPCLAKAEKYWNLRVKKSKYASQLPWKKMKSATQLLMARNVHQILGPDLDNPAGMVLYWTKLPEQGGTTFGLFIARENNIPCIRVTPGLEFVSLMDQLGKAMQNQGLI